MARPPLRSCRDGWCIAILACVLVVASVSPSFATDPVADLDCSVVAGDGVELTWTNPASVVAGAGYTDAVSALGPIGWWRLGETSGTTAVDQQALANGSYVDAPFLGFVGAINGDVDTAVAFDGSSDFVTIPHHADMLVDDGTVVLWFYPHTETGQHGLFSKDAVDFGTGGHLTVLWEAGRVLVRLQSATDSYFIESAALQSNCWHMVAVNFGPAGFRLFVDGVEVDSDPFTGGLGTSSGGAGNLEPITLGMNSWITEAETTNGLIDPYAGRLDEVSLHDGALTAAEIDTLYRRQVPSGVEYDEMLSAMDPRGYWRFEESVGPVAVDETAQNSGQYMGSVVHGVPGAMPPSAAAEFDATASEVVISDPSEVQLTGSMAVCFWFRPDTTSGTLVSLSNLSGTTAANTLYELEWAGDRFIYRHEFGSGFLEDHELLLTTPPTLGEWSHVVLRRSSGLKLLELFLDGELASSASYVNAPSGGTATDLRWAREPSGATPLVGALDEAAIFSRCLNVGEITALADPARGRSISVARDGVEISLLDGDATDLSQAELAPGSYEYCVTYEVDGVASRPECCVVHVLAPPFGLTCGSEADGVQLAWELGDSYDTLIVLRDGVVLATLPMGTTDYFDAGAPAGSFTYEVRGASGTTQSIGVNCVADHTPAVASLACDFDEENATLSWANPEPFDAVTVLRDGATVAVLGGGATSFTEVLSAGSFTYEVIATVGGVDAVAATCAGSISPSPIDVTCCSSGSGAVEICWVNPVGYDSVEVTRDGVVIAADAVSCVTDTPGSGSFVYAVTGMVGGQRSIVAECDATVLSPIQKLSCVDVSANCTATGEVSITWFAPGADAIEIFRDGVSLGTLAGTATQYTDGGVAIGTHDYTVTASAAECAIESANCTVEIAVSTPVSIDSVSSGGAVCEGESTLLSVSASGTAPVSYQWFHDGSAIAGATSASLWIDPMGAGDVGSYTAVVTNECGSATSSAVTLTLSTLPVDLGIAGPTSVCDGDLVTLTVSASGTAPLAYEWRRSGAVIPGASGPTLDLGAVSAGDGGSYDVSIANGCGTILSAAHPLIVMVVPTVESGPGDRTRCEGESAVFSVTAGGSGPFTYQWTFNGGSIVGATDATFILPSVTTIDAGAYAVEITGPCGSAVSAPATLTVEMAPVVTVAPIGGAFTEGDAATLTVAASGSAPLTYQWFVNGSALVGATDAALVLDPIALSDVGDYHCGVTNGCGTAQSAPATIVVTGIAPVVDVTCCATQLVLSLTWSDAASYDEVEVWRDGVLIGTVAAGVGSYTEVVPAAGSYDYAVVGRVGSFSSVPTTCSATVLAPVDILECDGLDDDGVALVWLAGGQPVDQFEIYRDGILIATLDGTATAAIDPEPEVPFVHTYQIVASAVSGGCVSTSTASCESVGTQSTIIFVRGDSNNDLQVDIADAIYGLNYQFGGGPVPPCLDAADINDDGSINIADAIYLTTYIFLEGPMPPTPFLLPGYDLTDDALDCSSSAWTP